MFGSAFGTFLMRQFFLAIPSELDDAATIDGAGIFRIYSQITLPLTTSALAVLAVFTITTVWNDFLWPLIILRDDEVKTLTLGLASFRGGTQSYTYWSQLMAAATMSVAPLIGPGSINQTDERYQIFGADLGIMWDNGQGQVLIAFGDAHGRGWDGLGAGPREAEWRSNTLAISSDRNLGDGLSFDATVEDVPGHAKEILPSEKINFREETVIPPAGIAVGGRQYIHYMSVNSWGKPGVWFTNYAGIAYSDDNGQSWTKDPHTRWENNATWTSRFQMAALARDGGYVYLFATPNGRFGGAYLAWVSEDKVLEKASYAYWDGQAWRANDEAAAAPIVEAPVAELSVQYNSYFRRWLMVFLDHKRAEIMLRDAPDPTGPWSEPKTLASGMQYPQLYGGFLHPWSSDGPDLYLTMCRWEPYSVYLIGTALSPVAITQP
jgi:hypothetical protein